MSDTTINAVGKSILETLESVWPEPATITDNPEELRALQEADFIDLYDMWPNGDRRWLITGKGREALSKAETQP